MLTILGLVYCLTTAPCSDTPWSMGLTVGGKATDECLELVKCHAKTATPVRTKTPTPVRTP